MNNLTACVVQKKKLFSNKQLKAYLGFVINCSVDAILLFTNDLLFFSFRRGGIVVYCS